VDAVTSLPGVSHLFRALRTPQQALVTGPALAATEAVAAGRVVTPGALVAGSARAVRRDLGFREVAEAAGVTGGTATVAGLVGDLVLDPLWIVTPAKLARAAKLPELMRSAPVQAGVRAVAESKPGQIVGKALVPDFGKPPEFVELAGQHAREVQTAIEQAQDIGRRIDRLPLAEQRAVREFMEAGDEPARTAVLEQASTAGVNAEAVRSLGREAMERDIALGRDLVDVGLMTEKTFERWRGRHVRREYTKYQNPRAYLEDLAKTDPERAAQLEAKLTQRAGFVGPPAPLRERLEFLKQRKDIPEDIRTAMGEILEAAGPVARGQALAGGAIARRRFMNTVAERFASDTLQPGFKYAGDSKALGPLKGKYLPEGIADDVALVIRRPGQAERLWKQGVGLWKVGKTALNPATHARNVVSNFILADMAGLAPFRVDRYGVALRDLVTDGRWVQEAKAAGAQFFANTFAGVELAQLGGVSSKLGVLQRAWGTVARAIDKPARLYQAEEQLFKLAFFIDQRMKGTAPNAAVEASERALFNYRKVPRLVDELRTWGVVPFASFPYFAAGATARALAHRPAAISRYGHLFRVFEDGDASASERQVLPRYMRDGWIRLPGTDADGRVRYVNGQYILPFGDLSELSQFTEPGEQNSVGRLVGQRVPVLQLGAAIVTGVDPFTGQDIDQQPGGWKAWLTNFALPPLAGGYAARELVAAAKGRPANPLSRYGEPRTLGQAALANVAGIRIRPVNLEEERRRRVEELAYDVRDIHQEMRRYQRSHWLTEDERTAALGEQMDRIRVLVQMVQRLEENPTATPSAATQGVDIDTDVAAVRRNEQTRVPPPSTRSGPAATVPPASAAAAAPSAAAPLPATTAVVGSVVTLRNGTRVRVTAVHADGSFDGEPVQ
jgi:hypothetical protein